MQTKACPQTSGSPLLLPNDSFMLKPTNYSDGDIIAMDGAYIDYSKFEDLTNRGVVYVTKMKKNLVYEALFSMMYIPEGPMEHRVQIVEFKKRVKDGEDVRHQVHALLPMPILIRKSQNSYHCLPMTWKMEVEDIIAIYRKRWDIELPFKQLKQNFPLRYFYGENSNAITNTDLGHPDSKSPSHGHTKAHQTHMEFLRIGYNDKNNAHVLRKLLHFS